MADGDVYICANCGALWIQDNQMWEEPDRCPKCGTKPGEVKKQGG